MIVLVHGCMDWQSDLNSAGGSDALGSCIYLYIRVAAVSAEIWLTVGWDALVLFQMPSHHPAG